MIKLYNTYICVNCLVCIMFYISNVFYVILQIRTGGIMDMVAYHIVLYTVYYVWVMYDKSTVSRLIKLLI